MKIEHLAIWVDDLERMREFYMKYFRTKSGEKYINSKKGFASYFLTFEEGGARLEIMNRNDIKEEQCKNTVDRVTELLRSDGYTVESEPRITGDGYYESVVIDPEGNPIEIVA